ncbi:MAG: hypothetical protein HDR11_15280 [Lachnospiraceae bacterium]|nr:hypothetical protein [Lachnospiraceae bacterium]
MTETGKTARSSRNQCDVKVIADLFGLSVRRIQQLTQDGVLETVETKSGRRYEMVPTVQKYIKYLSDKAYGKSKTETEKKLKEQKLRAEVALKESQGELHRLRTEIAAGKYISVEEVKLDYSRFFVSLKRFAMSVPSRLAGRLAGFADPVEVRQFENELHNEVQRLLNNFVLKFIVEEKEGDSGRA